jgi:hypothetical protein
MGLLLKICVTVRTLVAVIIKVGCTIFSIQMEAGLYVQQWPVSIVSPAANRAISQPTGTKEVEPMLGGVGEVDRSEGTLQ